MDAARRFDKFVKSYRDGEFTVKRRTRQGNVITTTTFVYGGVDFSSAPRTGMSAADFTAGHAELPGTVNEARQDPVADDDVLWLGGASVDRAAGPPGSGRNAAVRRIVVPLVATVTGLIVIGVAVAVVMLVFGKRPRRRPR